MVSSKPFAGNSLRWMGARVRGVKCAMGNASTNLELLIDSLVELREHGTSVGCHLATYEICKLHKLYCNCCV